MMPRMLLFLMSAALAKRRREALDLEEPPGPLPEMSAQPGGPIGATDIGRDDTGLEGGYGE